MSPEAATEEEQLQAMYSLRENLLRECGQARDTVERLQGFLSQSEAMVRLLDERIGDGKTANRPPSPLKPLPIEIIKTSPTPLPEAMSNSSLLNPTTAKLEELLAKIPKAEAVPSVLLKRRRLDSRQASASDFSPPPASMASILSSAKETGPRKAPVWDICGSTDRITVVPSSSVA